MTEICPGQFYRSVQSGYSKRQLTIFKKAYYDSKIKVLEWLVIRKDLNKLGFNDLEIEQAIINAFKKYQGRKKESFENKYLHWVTENIETQNKPDILSEQLSGYYSKSVEQTEMQGCKTLTWFEIEHNFRDFRISSRGHEDSILSSLLHNRFKTYKKYDSLGAKKGLGWLYLDKDNFKNSHVSFRTNKGEIILKLTQIINGEFNFEELILKEIKDFKEWNNPQINMNDKDLKAWIKDRGLIYIYDGNGHEKKNLIKKYIPTVKQERDEWQKDIQNITAKYYTKSFLNFKKGILEDIPK